MSERFSRYSDNGDGTLTDSATGLMWQESYAYSETGNYINWYDAGEYIEDLNRRPLGGHADWRLPNKLEVQTLYELSYSFESRGRTYFLHIDPVFEIGYGSCFWTWHTRLSGAMGFAFDIGEMLWYPQGSRSATVRAVRLNMNPFKLIRTYGHPKTAQ